jgi:hypothetical protein
MEGPIRLDTLTVVVDVGTLVARGDAAVDLGELTCNTTAGHMVAGGDASVDLTPLSLGASE